MRVKYLAQEHNAVPRPGLEPGPPDPESSALIIRPPRLPGYKSDDIKLLSASETKMSVWRDFVAACTASEKQAVSYSKFKDLWEQFHPNVVVAKPMTDLCVTCQQNT